MGLVSFALGVVPAMAGMAFLYVAFLMVLYLWGDETDDAFPLILPTPGEDEDPFRLRVGWKGAAAVLIAYQTGLALTYSGLLWWLQASARSWFIPGEFNSAFVLTSAAVVADSVTDPPEESLSLDLITGPWRVVVEMLLLVPWWFFPGAELTESVVGAVLGRSAVSRAVEFWTIVAVIVLWRAIRTVLSRNRTARTGRPTHG